MMCIGLIKRDGIAILALFVAIMNSIATISYYFKIEVVIVVCASVKGWLGF